MEKESLLKLLGEMQIGQSVGDSGHDSSWFAFRKAESITDSGVLPLLRELMEQNGSKERKELRKNAYFIMSSVLKKTFSPDHCQYIKARNFLE